MLQTRPLPGLPRGAAGLKAQGALLPRRHPRSGACRCLSKPASIGAERAAHRSAPPIQERSTHDETHVLPAYPPPESVVKETLCTREQYETWYRQSLDDPEAFWSSIAQDLYFHKPWEKPFMRYNFDVRQGPVKIEWFIGAQTNLCYNALDRHILAGKGDKVAFFWEGNDVGEDSVVTYQQLADMVGQIANYLKSVGVKKGDDVTIYMPMIPELPAAMLACARIGAVHSVVFAGFSAESLSGRILDSKPRVVLTTSAVKRGAKPINLKAIVDDALAKTEKEGHAVEVVLVYDNARAVKRESVNFVEGRDVWWGEAVSAQSPSCPVEWLDAEDTLFKLYTSGSTGKPKGVEHTQAGYMVGSYATFKYAFNYHEGQVYWCTADCGWITGHSYVTYGPLFAGATQVLYEGVPTYPDASRAWQITDKYKVNILYTAPTAIRSLESYGNEFVHKFKRDSLRILGTVGEPIGPQAWQFYYEVVGNSKCPIVDTWWQTETGAHMILPLPGATTLKPGSATRPFFGVEPALVDPESGKEIQGPGEGVLVIKRPWPSGMRTLSGDQERFENTYFAPYKGYYFTGDGARRDSDGYYWLVGRVDDVINVSGHRIGTAEVESALTTHPECSEAAVVPVDHPIKGQGIYAYVTLMIGHVYPPRDEIKKELIETVRKVIGPIATPDAIHWAPGLPKTRSGKIMRRILRKIAHFEEDSLGDISTLADPSVVEQLVTLRGK